MRNDPLRKNQFPERRSWTDPAPRVVSPKESMLADTLGVKPENILLVPRTNDALFALFRLLVSPAERVVVFDPSPDHHTSLILEANRAYVDCGRTYDWSPRLDALEYVLDEDTPLMLLASPNWPTGTRCDRGEFEEMVKVAPSAWWVVDRTYETGPSLFPVTQNVIQVLRIEAEDNEVQSVCVADALVLDALSALMHNEGPQRSAQEDPVWECMERDQVVGLKKELSAEGLRVAPEPRNWVFCGELGKDSKALAVDLRAKGYVVREKNHHTWRGHVVIEIPGERL